ncbi:DEAD/DEAH box helicase [Guptibacillus hwajinpoensis]|uniref:ATP-dependent RNA helicase CshA n=2 Tax=Guptibacillus hwajinpoensis TaxID=208199 RepID=A0A0J6CQV0_9BACL|nr:MULTISPECIES: DEAD/DEAH box helicase [Alkalihalobacillus]KMM38641.1 RNA helicase [Alkalihalobacillus macyae]MDP4551269.1 DEAD/DEAH box helicase [Alkalihalobacillus macyae]MDQ0482928.1 ATP-dependent RNA helicase DeaD [Alkalihalobacillus hemicentroti]
MKNFEDFALSNEVRKAVLELGFKEPTPIQEKALEPILEGRDIIGQAQTGTGKTAAFGIPIIEKVKKVGGPEAIILTPTRELAMQVAIELQKLSKHKGLNVLAVYGGEPIYHQIRALKKGVHIVVGTPGRMLDHLKRKTLRTDNVHTAVLDEADEMLDMGFIDDIELIFKQLPVQRQSLLFSATIPAPIRKLSGKYLKNPLTISVSKGDVTADTVEQVYYRTFESDKFDTLCRVIENEEIRLGIIFTKTKKGASQLTESLKKRGYRGEELHGDLTQQQRSKVMNLFRRSQINFLVATDIAARGIDVAHVSHVINYDIPEDPERYVHRIGRTGRAGNKGIALTLVTPKDMRFLQSIESKIKLNLSAEPLQDESVDLENIVKSVEKQLVNQKQDSSARETSELLLAKYDAHSLVQALLENAIQEKQNTTPSEYNFGETGGQNGMVRFFLNVGRNIDLHPKKLLSELSVMAGVDSDSVGRIDIFEKFSFFEVHEDVAPFVYEALRAGGIDGKSIHLEPAKPQKSRV